MEGTIGEVRMFAGNFAPRTWSFCNGQVMSIAQNTALFSILGTTYGGNGQTTFNLPDLRSRCAVGTGQGPGLSNITLGEVAGQENVTLVLTNIPAHVHSTPAMISNSAGTSATPVGNYPAQAQYTPERGSDPQPVMAYGTANLAAPTGGSNTGVTGSSQPFSNRNPYLGINYIICIQGIFPSRN